MGCTESGNREQKLFELNLCAHGIAEEKLYVDQRIIKIKLYERRIYRE